MKDIVDAISSRFRSPYFGYSVLAFFAFNWRGIFLLLTLEDSPQQRLAAFDSETCIWTLVIYPLLVGALVAASTHWVRLVFGWVSRKPLELMDILDLEAEHKKTLHQAKLEKSRSKVLAVKEEELIERAKRDEAVAGIEDSEAKERLAAQLDAMRRERDLLSEQLKQQGNFGTPSLTQLSQEEAEILSAAASQKNGSIIKPKSIGARTIQAGGHSFGQDSARDFAKYEEALGNLITLELVKEVGAKGEMFTLTSRGWKVADAL